MLGKPTLHLVGDHNVTLLHDSFETIPNGSEFVEICHRDLNIIRQDLVAVLQETADVRAALARFSPAKPILSKPFFLGCSVLGLLVVFVMIICEPQLREWLRWAQDIL